MNRHIDQTRNSNKRTYVQVEDARLATFIQFIVDNPREEIKEAARVTGIKYPRATALWRKNKGFIESQRYAACAERV